MKKGDTLPALEMSNITTHPSDTIEIVREYCKQNK